MSRTSLHRFVGNLAKGKGGTSAIEFGLIVPTMTMFVVGMIDMTRYVQLDYALTKVAARTIELALSKGPVDNSYNYLATEAAAAAGVTTQDVKIVFWLECNYVRKPDVNGSCPNGDLPFRYVSVDISTDYRSLFPGGLVTGTGRANGSALVRVQ